MLAKQTATTTTTTTTTKHGTSGIKVPNQISPTININKSIASQNATSALPTTTTTTKATAITTPSTNKDSGIKNQTNNIPLHVTKSPIMTTIKSTAPITTTTATATTTAVVTAKTVDKQDESKIKITSKDVVGVVGNSIILNNEKNEKSTVLSPSGKIAIENTIKLIEQPQKLEKNLPIIVNDEIKIKDNIANVPKIDGKKNKCEIVAKSCVNTLEVNKPNACQVPEKLEKLKVENDEKKKITIDSVENKILDGNVKTKLERKAVTAEKIKIIDEAITTVNKKSMEENVQVQAKKIGAVEIKTKVKDDMTVRQTIARSSVRATKAVTDNQIAANITTTTITTPPTTTTPTNSPSKKSDRLSNKSTKQNIDVDKIKNIIIPTTITTAAVATTTTTTTSNTLPIEKQNVVGKTKARPRRGNKRKYEKNTKSSASIANAGITAATATTSKTSAVSNSGGGIGGSSNSNKTTSTPVTDRKSQRHRLKTILYQSPLPELAYITKLSANEASNSPKPMINEDKLIVFYKNEYMAVRNAEGTFYLCQTMQNVYRTSPRISIRWLSEDDKNSDVYKPDFYDHTDIECVLTTVDLKRIDKGHLKLPINEKSRIENILKKAIDVEKGLVPRPELTEENPDGLDLSLYKDESQIEKKSTNSGSGRKTKRHNNNLSVHNNSFQIVENRSNDQNTNEEENDKDDDDDDDDDEDIPLNKRKRTLKTTGRVSVSAKKTKRKVTAGKRNRAKGITDSGDESIASDDDSEEEYKPKQKKINTIAVSASTTSCSSSKTNNNNNVTPVKSSPRAQRSLLAMARAASPLLSTPTTSRALNSAKSLIPKTTISPSASTISTTTTTATTSVSRSERATKRKAAVEHNSNTIGTISIVANNSKITQTKNKEKESHEVKEIIATINENATSTINSIVSISNTTTTTTAIVAMTTTTTSSSSSSLLLLSPTTAITTSSLTTTSSITENIVGSKSATDITTQSIPATTNTGSSNRPTRSRK